MNGYILKKLRKEKGLSQIELSKKLNVTQGTIARIESNNRVPSMELTKKIAKFFDVSLDYLEGLVEDKNGITQEKEALVSDFLKFLVENGIIKDENNIDKSTEELILAMVRKEIAKLKDGD